MSVVKESQYVESIGRRKTAIARVRVFPGSGKGKKIDLTINEKAFHEYFPEEQKRRIVVAPFEMIGEEMKTTVKVKGGGGHAQAEAIRLGIARVLVKMNSNWGVKLRAMDLLKRDPRMVERKKYGFRKARRPQQWRKR